jgi:hypothetical protein
LYKKKIKIKEEEEEEEEEQQQQDLVKIAADVKWLVLYARLVIYIKSYYLFVYSKPIAIAA